MQKILLFTASSLAVLSIFGQKKLPVITNNVDSVLLSKTKDRSIGPYRGGRSGAVVGDTKNKNTFYFGGTEVVFGKQ
jgi:hypothetical protein